MKDDAVKKAIPQDYAGICGLYWKGNAWYDALERTCATQDEMDLGKICPVYACARAKGVEHCGVCSEFPCDLLVNLAAQRGSADNRIDSAAKRADLGDDVWAEWAQGQRMWTQAFCPLRNAPATGRRR